LKKFIIVLLAIVLVASLAIVGCAAPTPAPEPTPAPSPSPEPTPSPTPTPAPEETVFPEGDWFVKADGTPYKFAYICDQTAGTWMVINSKFLKSLIERGGGKLTILNCDQDIARQSASLEDTLLAKPDAMIFHPVSPPTCIPYIEEAAKIGIPSFSMMMPPLVPPTGTPDPRLETCYGEPVEIHEDIVTYVGNYQMGRAILNAEYLVNYCEEKGTPGVCFEVWGLYGYEEFSGPMHRVFHDKIKDSPWIEVVHESAETAFTDEGAYTATLDGLTAHPDVNLIFSQADCMLGGVIEALKALDRYVPDGEPGHVEITTSDAIDWVCVEIEKGLVGMSVLDNAAEYADTMAKALWWYVVAGEEIEKEYFMENIPVTKDNVKEIRAYWADLGEDYDQWPAFYEPKFNTFIKFPDSEALAKARAEGRVK